MWPRSSNKYFEAQNRQPRRPASAGKPTVCGTASFPTGLRKHKDIAAVALEAGNSARMIFAHYRELCTESEAAEWFGIVPATAEAGNIVQMTV